LELVKVKCINREYSQLSFTYNPKIIGIVKNTGQSFFSGEDKNWYIKNEKVRYLIANLKKDGVALNLDKIIQKHLKLTAQGKTAEEVEAFKKKKREHPSYAITSNYDQTPLDLKKGMELYPYQKAGVEYGIGKGGRILIGDDMGLGKTAQAIALASYYRNDWPLVIAAPASLILNWKKELLMWLDFLNEEDIHVIKKGSQKPKGIVTICSYDYCFKRKEWLSQYLGVRGLLIVDEAHAMKNSETNRGAALIELSHAAKRSILISGTPFLNRPIEIWSLLYALNPLHEKWREYNTFAEKYCEGKLIKMNNKTIFDVSGASNMEEFHDLIRDELMVRRLKTDDGVLDQLPEKRRVTQYLEPDKNFSKDLAKIVSDLEAVVMEYYPKHKNNLRELKRAVLQSGSEVEDNIFKAYQKAGQSKIGAICNWVEDKFEDGLNKLIIFGHHSDFLDGIQATLEKKKIGFMRIDGTVSKNNRFERTEEFQNNPDCKVALLSVGAGSVGLTLTAASSVLIGEMPWTPAISQQAEARAHRNGQKESVTCYYAIANGTFDGHLWNMLSKKSTTSSNMLDGGLGDEMEDEIDINTEDILDAVILSVVEKIENGTHP
jgi:SWI/SNF-related matrix-associated actin-dependent regulator 1 of chromatin subfamily A